VTLPQGQLRHAPARCGGVPADPEGGDLRVGKADLQVGAGNGFRRDVAQHVITRRPHLGDELLDLRLGDQVFPQHAAEDLHGGLEFLGDHLVGPQIVQDLHLLDEAGPDDHVEFGIHLFGQFGDPPRRRGIVDDDDHRPGVLDVGVAQYRLVGGVAVVDRLPGFPLPPHRLGIHLQDHVGDRRLGRGPAHVPAVEAVTDDDQVIPAPGPRHVVMDW